MDFLKLAAERYSCKRYDARQVDEDALAKILEAGRLAPTAKNLQEQRIYVMQQPQSLALIDKHTRCRYGAPTVLVVAYDQTQTFTYPGEKYNSGAEDASIVAAHLMLAAASLGVDSCWLNLFDPDALAKDMNLPANETILMLLDLGYASAECRVLPHHNSRKPLAETVEYR